MALTRLSHPQLLPLEHLTSTLPTISSTTILATMATSEISCGYGLASSGQREREEDHHHVASRLRTQLHSLVNRLIERCNIGTPISVEPRSPHAPFLTENAAYYNELGAQYFVIETTGATGSEHVPGGLDTDSDAVKLGAVMYDNCVNAALLCWPALRVLFEGMSSPNRNQRSLFNEC
jgi:hypothetical protein